MKTISVHQFSEKMKLIQSFDPQTQTWVVSDLQSKWELQKLFLESHSVLDENSILRASEFWTKILFRAQPDIKIISSELLDQWIWGWLKKNPNSWSRVVDSAKSIRLHLEFFAPIFSHQGSEELMEEWFEKNPDSLIRWRHVFEVCKRVWSDLDKEKLLTVSLIPSRFLESGVSQTLWDKSLIFDLGPCSRGIEKKLADQLGQVSPTDQEVTWIETIVKLDQFHLRGELYRLPTQLGEVKEAVAQVREWLGAGVKTSEIAILAPDVEKFWPAFHLFFKSEGIPVQKPLLQKLIDDPKIQSWLSKLHVELGDFTKENLESYYFQETDSNEIGDEEFERYFSKLTNPIQAARWPKWKMQSSKLSPSDAVTLLEFMGWSLNFWPERFGQESMDRIWKALSKDHFDEFRMNGLEWLSYFKQRLAKAEQVLVDEADEGIHLLGFSSAEWLSVSHLLTLGLSEQDLKHPSNLIVSPFEAQRLNQDLGFEMEYTLDQLECHWAWVSTKEFRNQVHLSSGVNFVGEDITPSKYWLKAAYSAQSVNNIRAPRRIRWDELALELGQGFKNSEIVETPIPDVTISATTLKSYWKCPFTFFAQKGLRLTDQPTLDFDLDPMNKGRLMHGVFERLIQDWGVIEWSEESILSLIDEVRSEQKIEIGEERMWPTMKMELLKLSNNFLEMERELRSKLPHLKTVGQEVSFEFDFENLKVKGRIDRIDSDSQGRAAIVDYKSSSSGVRGHSSWKSNGDFQMVIYTVAVEQGHTDLKELWPVEAAYYNVPKSKDRDKGFFVVDGQEPTLYTGISSRSRSRIQPDAKVKLISENLEEMKVIVGNIRQGMFLPDPKDKTDCLVCKWNKLCRAPHLI